MLQWRRAIQRGAGTNIILYGYGYRYKVLVGKVRERLEDILTELCEWLGMTILEGQSREKHVHMYLSVSRSIPRRM